MTATAVDNEGDVPMGNVSPREKTSMEETIEPSLDQMDNGLSPLVSRADPDAQTTVTDFLDFTEYLPSDMIRSLTLIGKLDQTYADASVRVDELTKTWGQLPSLAGQDRPSPVQLRADISEHLSQATSSRAFAHAEAVRMSENVHRHYKKAKILLSKLQTMMENYPTEEQKSPVASKSPQMVRAKLTVRATGEGGQKVRRQRVPRITVPGEVLAPYDLEYDFSTDESDESSDEDSDTPAAGRRTPAPAQRIKLVSNKSHKSTHRAARPVPYPSAALSAAAAANAAALLNPPPENAVIGSPDAPWLQLTQYELAKLRKRMKKNATWTPSETMIARELKALGRGPDAFREAKKKAEEDGKVFEPPIPKPVIDDESGTQQLPAGAISVDSLAANEVPTSNRGMKLNEAKKLKRDLAKLAAEEAEESARKMNEAAKLLLHNGNQKATNSEPSKDVAAKTPKSRANSRSNAKRKREPDPEPNGDAPEGNEAPVSKPPLKRTKTETPVPPPTHHTLTHNKMSTPEITAAIPHLETPVPIPIPPQGSYKLPVNRAGTSPGPSASNANHAPSSAQTKPPTETPVPLPMTEQRKSATPVLPLVRETPARETKRETRGEAAKRSQQQQLPMPTQPQQSQQVVPEPTIKQSSSRGPTPRTTPAPETHLARRPSSRGKAMSQEPLPSLAADRPRRTSTARNTPAPEVRPPSKRTKRPAPGVVSTTNSGGNSAVGKRKAAPRKKARTKRDKDKGLPTETEMEEVDDEGNPIDPDEPRYCLCNRVSFGTMIQCDNVDVSGSITSGTPSYRTQNSQLTPVQNCKQEWFHLECVNLSEIPARTTKWYCPDCRKLLNLGEKGEVSARGVRK